VDSFAKLGAGPPETSSDQRLRGADIPPAGVTAVTDEPGRWVSVPTTTGQRGASRVALSCRVV